MDAVPQGCRRAKGQHCHDAAENMPAGAAPAESRICPKEARLNPCCRVFATQLYCAYEQKIRCLPFCTTAGRRWRDGGCGPKDIGAGSSSENDSQPQGVSVEDQLRYPVYGSNNTQRMLYYQNRPDVMANMQQWRMQQFRRMNGLDTDVNPEDPQYRAVPKQRSPFRQ